MSVLDKFLDVMRLNPDDDYEYDEYDSYEEDYEDEKPLKRTSARRDDGDEFEEKRKVKNTSKITPMRQPRGKGNDAGMEVCVIKPSTVEDAREITETLLANRTVVLNMEGLDVDVAQRIIDFASGSCFAISGNLQKVSNYIFVITPSTVDISGDFQNIMDSFDKTGFKSF